jgi:uncharacterized protein (TIGR02217 family)
MATFPIALPGQGWSVTKTPRFATRIQKSVSGRRLALIDQPNPIWEFTLTFPVLRDPHDTRAGANIGLGVGYDELRTLMGFFLQQQGAFQPFLFFDPTDFTVTGQAIATGDGTTTTFQLVRTFGVAGASFTEAIRAPSNINAIKINGVTQSSTTYSVDPGTGLLTFTGVPSGGAAITADFTYFFRCVFSDDSLDFENFMYQLWQLKQVKLESVLN